MGSTEKWKRVHSLYDLDPAKGVDPASLPEEWSYKLEHKVETRIIEELYSHAEEVGVTEDELADCFQLEMFDNNGGPLIDYSLHTNSSINPFDTLHLNIIVSMHGYDVLVRG